MKGAPVVHAATRRATSFLCVAAIGAFIFEWIAGLHYIVNGGYTIAVDFTSYYTAAQALRFDPTANIYSVHTVLQAMQGHHVCVLADPKMPPYLYPPFLAIVLQPLTFLSCADATAIWFGFNLVLWVLSTLLLADLLGKRWPGRRLEALTVAVGLSLLFLQALYGLFLGQVHLVVLFGFVLTFWLLDHDHPWLAGGVLAIITAIKVLPALLIVYYLLRGRFRVVGGAAILGAGIMALMLVYTGPTTFLRCVLTLLSASASLMQRQDNESLRATLQPTLGLLLAALAGVVSLLVILRRRHGDEFVGACWTLCLMLLLSPLVWRYYLVWLLPAFCALLATGPFLRVGWRARGAWVSLVICYLVLAFPLWQPLRPFATLALWGLTGALYWRSARSESLTDDVVGPLKTLSESHPGAVILRRPDSLPHAEALRSRCHVRRGAPAASPG